MGVTVRVITYDQIEKDRATIHHLMADTRRLLLDRDGLTLDGQDKRLLLSWVAKLAADSAVDLRRDPTIAALLDRVAKRQAEEAPRSARA